MTRRFRVMFYMLCALTLAFFACAIVGAIEIGKALGIWAAGAI